MCLIILNNKRLHRNNLGDKSADNQYENVSKWSVRDDCQQNAAWTAWSPCTVAASNSAVAAIMHQMFTVPTKCTQRRLLNLIHWLPVVTLVQFRKLLYNIMKHLLYKMCKNWDLTRQSVECCMTKYQVNWMMLLMIKDWELITYTFKSPMTVRNQTTQQWQQNDNKGQADVT